MKVISVYLEDILDQAELLMQVTKEITYEEYLTKNIYQNGVARSFEIIGEAAKQIPEDVRIKYPDVPWKKIAGLRDRLIHAYSSVNYRLLWELAMTDVPVLHQQIAVILSELKE